MNLGINTKITTEEAKLILPYEYVMGTAVKGYCSRPITSSEFLALRKLEIEHGYSPPGNFGCSSCVLWVLSALQNFFRDPQNKRAFSLARKALAKAAEAAVDQVPEPSDGDLTDLSEYDFVES